MTKEEIDKYYNYARTNGKWMHLMMVKKIIEDCFNKPNMHWDNHKELKATYENWLMITSLPRAISIINRQNANLWGIPAWNSAGPIYKADLF